MTVYLYPGDLADHQITATLRGKSLTVERYGDEPDALELSAKGGRVNECADLVAVSDGILRQQFDGKATLDLTEVRGPATLTGVTADGTPATILVSQMISKDGWTPGHSYMLETDEDGDLIIEPGEYSRDIYMSADPASWTAASIAAAQQPPISASAVTGAWLLARDYGTTQAGKVSSSIATLIINAMMEAAQANGDKIRPAYRLGIERGYEYNGFIVGGHGQSPLHPNVIFAFGTGTAPGKFYIGQNGGATHSNHVLIDVVAGVGHSFENFLLADVYSQGKELGGNVTSLGAGFTLYRTFIADVHAPRPLDASNNPADDWTKGRNITKGVYLAQVFGTSFIDTIWDHNAWQDNFHVDENGVVTGLWNNGQYGQPMTQYSHNIYTSEHNADMTWDGLISMRSASVAGQMRIGGWQYDCTSISDRVAMQNSGMVRSDLNPAKASENGFHSISIRGVATNPSGIKSVVGFGGAKTTGLDYFGADGTDIDCLAIHARNPDDLANEMILKPTLEPGFNTQPRLWSNAIIYGWDRTQRISGLSEAFMKTITIQRWAAQKLGQPTASIADYADYLRSLTPRQRQLEIRAVNRYMLSAVEPNLELPLAERTVPETVIFKPDWRGEGRRLDNPLNLSTKSRLIDGDSLDLHGNYARWLNWTRSLDHLTVGEGGLLEVSSGRLSFDSADAGSDVKVSHCGKLYLDAFDGNVTVRGGRFAVSAPSAGSVEASGQGEMIFGPSWTVRDGEKARIVGDMGWVGWDGISGPGTLTIEAGGTLEFHATPVVQYAEYDFAIWYPLMGSLIGETSGATGEFDSWRRRTNRNAYVRIRDMIGTPIVGERTTKEKYLKPASGKVAAILPAVIGKIEKGWKGRLGAANTSATFEVILSSGSQLVISNRNLLPTGTYDLTGPGITVVNNGATLPAGVSVTGGKLVLVVS